MCQANSIQFHEARKVSPHLSSSIGDHVPFHLSVRSRIHCTSRLVAIFGVVPHILGTCRVTLDISVHSTRPIRTSLLQRTIQNTRTTRTRTQRDISIHKHRLRSSIIKIIRIPLAQSTRQNDWLVNQMFKRACTVARCIRGCESAVEGFWINSWTGNRVGNDGPGDFGAEESCAGGLVGGVLRLELT